MGKEDVGVEEGVTVVGEDAGVREGDIGVGERATVVGEEDATTTGQGGSEVCGGRAKGGEEHSRWLTALRSVVGGA
jgi:hypothetical protein